MSQLLSQYALAQSADQFQTPMKTALAVKESQEDKRSLNTDEKIEVQQQK